MLFTVVCVIIATGVLLPVYPGDVSLPAAAGARDTLLADDAALGPAACVAPASPLAPGRAGATPTKACMHLTVYVIVGPLPVSGHVFEPARPLPELPTI